MREESSRQNQRSGERLERRFAAAFTRLFPGAGTVLVALSGGGDSMALLALLDRLCRAGTVAAVPIPCHVDHGMRPESGKEAQWLAGYVEATFGRALRIVARRVTPRPGESGEMAARRERYAALAKERERSGASAVALAHQYQDQAETVLMRVLSGTSVPGLGAMRPVRGFWIRPLLSFHREELREYLTLRGIRWLEDPSNRDPRPLRNRLRQELMPEMRRRYNPALDRALVTLAGTARMWTDFMDDTLQAWVDAHQLDLSQSPLRLPPSFGTLHPALKNHLLARWGEERGLRLTRRHLDAALAGTCAWPGGCWVVHEPDGTVLLGTKRPNIPDAEEFWVSDPLAPGELELPRGGRLLMQARGESLPAGPSSQLALAPATLRVRYWQPGDRLRPVGMEGSKKLQDLFVDRKIPKGLRHRWPVLLAGARVAAVPGLAVAEFAAGERWHAVYLPGAPLSDETDTLVL